MWPFLAGLGWGVLALGGVEFIVLAKAIQRSGLGLKTWLAAAKMGKPTGGVQ